MRSKFIVLTFLMLPAFFAMLPPFISEPFRGVLYQAFHLLCHQMGDRCFDIRGVEMAVCHRCLGIYLGIPLALFFGDRVFAPKWLFLFAAPLGLDWGLHQLGFWENTPFSQFSSGLILGIGVGFFAVRGFLEIANNLMQRKKAQ